MKLVEKLLSLYEKLIIINKGKRNGQVLFLAGGGGSGKGFAQEKFIDVNSYKVFDVDALKSRLIKLAQIRGDNPKLANLDLRRPDDVAYLHQYVSDKGLDDKVIDNLLKDVSKDKGLPNLLFDVTLKNVKKFEDISSKLAPLGYDPKDMHLVWILSDYEVAVQQNAQRSRVVPADIMFQTHDGAAKTMSQILAGNLPKNLQGEVYILLSDANKNTPFYFSDISKDGLTDKVVKGKSALSGRETQIFRDFLYVKVKDAGKPMASDSEVQKLVYDWAKDRVPREAAHLFK